MAVASAIVTDMVHPGVLTDGVIELRRWQDGDVAAVRARRGDSEEAALAWVRRQQARPLSVGISCAIAPIGQPAVGYGAGMIRVEALLDPRNIASRRVVEKSGFRPEGHLRSYLEFDGHPADALVYSLLQSDL